MKTMTDEFMLWWEKTGCLTRSGGGDYERTFAFEAWRTQAARITELEALSSNLKQEAQIHAMEARGANATINEINQFISGATGEPANWHGAQPVKDFVNDLNAQLADAKKDVELLDFLEEQQDISCQDHDAHWIGVDGGNIRYFLEQKKLKRDAAIAEGKA